MSETTARMFLLILNHLQMTRTGTARLMTYCVSTPQRAKRTLTPISLREIRGRSGTANLSSTGDSMRTQEVRRLTPITTEQAVIRCGKERCIKAAARAPRCGQLTVRSLGTVILIPHHRHPHQHLFQQRTLLLTDLLLHGEQQ